MLPFKIRDFLHLNKVEVVYSRTPSVQQQHSTRRMQTFNSVQCNNHNKTCSRGKIECETKHFRHRIRTTQKMFKKTSVLKFNWKFFKMNFHFSFGNFARTFSHRRFASFFARAIFLFLRWLVFFFYYYSSVHPLCTLPLLNVWHCQMKNIFILKRGKMDMKNYELTCNNIQNGMVALNPVDKFVTSLCSYESTMWWNCTNHLFVVIHFIHVVPTPLTTSPIPASLSFYASMWQWKNGSKLSHQHENICKIIWKCFAYL